MSFRFIALAFLGLLITANTAISDKPSATPKSQPELRREVIQQQRRAHQQMTRNLIPEFSVCPRSHVRNITFVRRGDDLELTWTGQVGKVYEVHRSTQPQFAADFTTQLGTVIGNSFTDWNALRLRPVRYYYQVIER